MNNSNRYRLIKASIFVLFVILAIAVCVKANSLNGTIQANDPNSISSGFGLWSLIPLVMAVSLALLFKDVLISVFISELTAITMYTLSCSAKGSITLIALISNFFHAFEVVVLDSFNMHIMLMIMCTCGMIEVINHNGGFLPLANYISDKINSPGKVNLVALVLGFITSFDDYSSVLIVAPIMKPITDKMGVSREKLAFIVDATAAPCAALLFISTWVSTELLAIENGFNECGINASSYVSFLKSVPFSFYSILALIFILISGVTGLEYGPMLTAERNARKLNNDNSHNISIFQDKLNFKSFVLPLIPIFVFIIFILCGFAYSGINNMINEGLITNMSSLTIKDLSQVFGKANTGTVMFEAAGISSIIAIIIHCITHRTSIKESVSIWIEGISGAVPTGILLIFTWAFASTIKQIGTCLFIVNIVTSSISFWMAPVVVFLTCCLISFAIGSIGTLFIAMPIAIPVASAFMNNPNINNSNTFLCIIISCVLSGSLFGDHCSPISDTTILSAQTCGCSNINHVRTQLPYALTVALSSTVSYILVGIGIPYFISLICGILLIFSAIKIFGRLP